ncbi:MAG: Cys-tRNA(Pro) deacylase [Sutterellaceae bacterium]|nr:Cys-tRNA(Pro) deacylase [Burkholderiaceae bacterium]MCX7900810.1 Cys-tRNA(Pro) deacylase [Burkholderiaceae bacterium]MDW8430483.1 Cys-tRNA(Pro) deacylase [Sutterellaceae bacterium]
MGEQNAGLSTPATQGLRRHRTPCIEHVADYVEHGGTWLLSLAHGIAEHEAVRTLVMRPQLPLVLVHGDRKAATKTQPRCKKIERCSSAVQRPTGDRVSGASPVRMRKLCSVDAARRVLTLPKVDSEGSRRGFRVRIARVLQAVVGAVLIDCALAAPERS